MGHSNGGGIRAGVKRKVTEKMREANRRNARKPRVHASPDEKMIRAATRLSMVEFLTGPALRRMKRLAMTGPADVAARAYFGLCDRFGFPPMSEQTVRGEMQIAPLIEFKQTSFERPGEAKPEGAH